MHNEIVRRRPDLARVLAGPWYMDRKACLCQIVLCALLGAVLTCAWLETQHHGQPGRGACVSSGGIATAESGLCCAELCSILAGLGVRLHAAAAFPCAGLVAGSALRQDGVGRNSQDEAGRGI